MAPNNSAAARAAAIRAQARRGLRPPTLAAAPKQRDARRGAVLARRVDQVLRSYVEGG